MPLPVKPPVTPAEAYAQSAQMALNVVNFAQRVRSSIDGDKPIQIIELVSLFDVLRSAKDTGEALAVTPDLEAYAKTVMGDAYSITDWFQNVLVSGTIVTEWLVANLPGDGDGGIVLRRFVVGGNTTLAVMTPSQLSPLAPLLDDLMAALRG